jgi:threonine dehydrogenase-like Zn-dependent dehydrogenase
MEQVLAMTQTGKEVLEPGEYELPTVPSSGAIVKMEAVGVCGSDVRQFLQEPKRPRILGHENVGRIHQIGESARAIWGLEEGDLVCLEEYVGCHRCEWCRIGEYRHCFRTDVSNNPDALRYGTTPTEVPPAIWGGYSRYLYMPFGAVWHRVPEGVRPEDASLFIALGNGVQWTTVEGGLKSGQRLLVQGPGQMGAACVVAARSLGAELVIVTGLSLDADRLEVCRQLGADATIDVEKEDVRERVHELTGGHGVDVTIDATARAGAEPLQVAVDVLKRRGGHMVVQGGRAIDGFPLDRLLAHYVTLQTARGHSYASVERGLQILSSGRFPLHLMHTHDFSLSEATRAVNATKGELVDGRRALHVAILPWS